MSDIAVQVDNMSKRYRIGRGQEGRSTYGSLRETLADAASAPIRRLRRSRNRGSQSEQDFIWALKDVAFEVKKGEVVGIIGRNGAGKTTLLKVLSRITRPTKGKVRLWGRVGSLLEVGTGFHPELTGRENIYLNGAVLGMQRGEIERKFDEIVDFAEIEQFLDTPVKHYSSGMYMRLAFAVAAHLEPEILLVDEVLAVGDAAFQKKCLGKMGEVAREGRTVLFVSHNMTAIKDLCPQSLLIDEGQIRLKGDTDEVVSHYLYNSSFAVNQRVWDDYQSAPGNKKVRLHLARITSDNGYSLESINVTTPFVIEFEFWNLIPNLELNFSLFLYTPEGVCVLNTGSEPKIYPVGLVRSKCFVPGNFLNDGYYRIEILIVEDGSFHIYQYDDILFLEVHDVKRDVNWHGKWLGVVRPEFRWDTEFIKEL